ncbi:MAG: beta-N-acetylhexosaminidase, partial [Planctomycetota bacterium]|nr:beta-N-acetylhexosaminidase [Planctomycetota bacterium]
MNAVADKALPAFSIRIGSPRCDAPEAPAKPEGYTLITEPHGIWLRGYDRDGLFWGLITLQQLFNQRRSAPCAVIKDWPAFPFRMHHDDISRKQISTADDFCRIIQILSYFKIRYYTLYIEDMLHLPSHPDIGRGRGKLMPGEIRKILAAAQRHNIIVFPTYSLIGHQENLLALPRYRRYAREVFQGPSSYDVAKPIFRPFLRQVIRDVCAAFPDAPYFHAGFDEVIGLSKDEVIAHANWCCEEISRYGKTMLMWVDMFKNHFGLEALQALDRRIILVEWNYHGRQGPEEIAPRYARLGL